ncbi:MAG: hypothetical protein QNJ51_19310 [Calothrix sp. MO_167.B12]|nr:hypothetical protein [Calothrix sp. MO_167.B12]
MSFFNDSVPPLRRKQTNFDIHDLEGLWCITWQVGNRRLYSNFYTCVDKALMLWGILLIPIFITAQFIPMDWDLQATIWSILSCLGIGLMVALTTSWVQRRQFCWVLYCWVLLMLLGVVLTDLGIFLSRGIILSNLCCLWLGLSAIGYFCTGLGMRSRTMLLMGTIHLLGIFILHFLSSWQFLTTGALMVFCLLLLAEFEWDHC